MEWADGVMSATQVAKHMSHALEDGMSDPLVARLAKHAQRGSRQNCNANFRDLLEELGIMGLISTIPDSTHWTHFVKPSSLIAYIANHRPADLKACLGCDLDKTTAFWTDWYKSKMRTEMAQGHSVLRGKTAQDLLHTVPLVVHEDAGPITKKLSANCLSFSSLLATGPEKTTKFLMATGVKYPADDHAAWTAILHDMVQLATGCVDGQVVARDSAGSPWCFVLMLCKGDEEVRSVVWGFASYSSSQVCSECGGNKSTLPYTDLTPEAQWRATETHKPVEPYLAKIQGNHPLIRSPFTSRFLA